MYTQQQLTETVQRANQQPLTAADVRKAREQLLDAREKLRRVENGEDRSIFSLQELRDKVLEADRRYKDVSQHAGHLEFVEHTRQVEAEQERTRAEAQALYATEQEAEAKADYRTRYLAAGGTPAQFEHAWAALWQQELERRIRTLHPTDTMQQKLLASGKYSA